MNTIEIIIVLILGLVVAIPLFILIAGFIKNEIEKGEKGSTGIVGWIIAILIASAIFYALFFAGSDFNHFRHT